MTNDKTVTMSRELLETTVELLSEHPGYYQVTLARLRAILAAPVVERQEPMAWFTDDHLTDKSATTYDVGVSVMWAVKGWPVTPLYTSPPEPVSVMLPDRNDIVKTIAATCYFEAKDPALVAGWTYDYIFSQLVALARVKAKEPNQ